MKIDKVIYVVTEDDQTELKRYKADELDVTNEIPSDQLEAVKAEFGDEVRITPYLEFGIHLLQHHQGAVRQHQGAAGAGDRHRSQGAAGQDPEGGLPGQLRLMTPISDPRYPAAASAGMRHVGKAERSEKGKALLAEAGFGPDNPLKVTIESTTDNTAKKMAEGVALMWKQNLGVDAKVNAQEFQAWMDTFYAGGWEVINDNLVAEMPGPEFAPRLLAAERRVRLLLEERRV